MVAAHVVPGKNARHAGRNAHGAERADEQDALARAGNLAGLQGFLHPLVRNPSFRGIAHIQGFLDAAAMNKKILCLGHLDFIQHSNILHLASLEEMIAQPLLKRRLWQLMQ